MDERLTYLAKRLTLLLGVLAIGAALGLTVGLEVLQTKALAAGSWPTLYDTSNPMTYPLYAGARALQTAANLSAGVGAVLLLGYGLIDYAGRETVDVDEWLEEQGEGADDG